MINIIKKFCLTALLAVICCVPINSRAWAEEQRVNSRYAEAYFTSIAAASCLGVYLEEEDTEYNYLRSMGWEIEPHVSRLGKVETHYTVAKRFFRDVNKQVFMVTFRGSTTSYDWKINLKTKKVNYGGSTLAEIEETAKLPVTSQMPAVHGGFNTYATSVLRDSVVSDEGYLRGVFGYVQETSDAVLILTGHSMGGAVATIVGTRLVDLGFPKDRLHILTFGAPAIGNTVYNENFANKLDVLRITNTNDPIPGSLQTFFSGYTQCGRQEKYHLSPQIGNMQHDMAMYFDHSIINLYKIKDEEIAAGRMKDTPKAKLTKGVPKVALWIKTSPGLSKMPLMPPVRRLLIDQYARVLPSYIIMDDKLDDEHTSHQHDLISVSARVGADYIMICGIDSTREKNKQNSWFLTQEQSLFYKNGQMLSVTDFAKKVVPAIGNVQAAGENYLIALNEMRQYMPFIKPTASGTIQ